MQNSKTIRNILFAVLFTDCTEQLALADRRAQPHGKEKTMKQLIALTTALTLTMAPMAYAGDVTVGSVAVEAKLAAGDDTNALKLWPDVTEDLQKMVKDAVQPMMADDGVDVKVRLTEMSLEGETMLPDDGEFNWLSGWVFLYRDGTPVKSFPVIMRADSPDAVSVPGAVIVVAPNDSDYYNALLAGFAAHTAQVLDNMTLPPEVAKP